MKSRYIKSKCFMYYLFKFMSRWYKNYKNFILFARIYSRDTLTYVNESRFPSIF